MRLASGRYALAAAATLLPLLGGVLVAYSTWRATVTAAERGLADRADLALENASRFAETQSLILRELKHAIGQQDDDQLSRDQGALHAGLARLSEGLPQVWDVLVWARNGDVLATANLFPVPKSNAADRDYFRAVAGGAPEPYVSTILHGRLDRVTFFNITVARRDDKGAFVGLTGVALDPVYFETRYIESGLADPDGGAGIALLRADGTILARAPASLGERGQIWPEFSQAVQRGPGPGRFSGAPGSGTWAIEYRKIPNLPLFVLATLSTEALRRRWWNDFQLYLAFGVVATLLMLTLVGQVLRGAARADRAAAEAALRADDLARSEARARALFINSPDIRTIAEEREDGNFVFLDVNEANLKTFGWRRDEILGKTIFDLYPRPLAEEATARMRESLELGRPITYEARRFAAGDIRYFDITMVPVPNPDGSRARTVVTNARDITEQRKIEAHLREAQKMETVSQLAGGLAHDFNNILVIVGGQLDRLQVWLDRNTADEQPRRYLQHALSGIERGSALVRRMLTFARQQEARPEALDVAALIANLVEFVRVTVGAAVTVQTELPPPGAHRMMVRADATQIELAVVNLALNARDAMPDGGTITLAAATRHIPAQEADLADGDYAVVEVRDTGEGMDEATLARAAEPFFTTKEPGKGTGLGLAMVRGLAVQTGGALRLQSRLGEGTTVSLWLPLAEQPAIAGEVHGTVAQ